MPGGSAPGPSAMNTASRTRTSGMIHRRDLSLDVKKVATDFLLALAPVWTLITGLAIIDSPTAYKYAGPIVPLTILFLGGWTSWRLTTQNRTSLLTPLPLTFAFVSLIYGLGPLLYVFRPAPEYGTVIFRMHMDPNGIFRVQVLNVVGLTFLTLGLLTVSTLALRVTSRSASLGRPSRGYTVVRDVLATQPPAASNERFLLRAYLVFTVIAIAIRSMHWFGGTNPVDLLPGFLNFVDFLGSLAIMLGAILAARKGGLFWLLPLLPLGVELVEGFLLLMKSRILIPIVFALFGMYLGGKSMRVLAVGAAFCLSIFVLLYPVIDAGRRQVWTSSDITSLEYYAETDPRHVIASAELDLWHAWARWDFTAVQHTLMTEFDAGRPGDTFGDLPWLFIPRFLFPNKPVLDYGARVNALLYGHRRSAVGATIFGEAYWNGGWPLVVASAFVAGGVLFVLTLTCLWLFSQQSVLAWAIGITGVLLGRRLQNFFTSGLIAPAVIVFVSALMLRFVLQVRIRVRFRRSRRHALQSMQRESVGA